MKIRATIMESVEPTDTSVIVRFESDPSKQHFELHFNGANPYNLNIRKWDFCWFKIKWVSEVFEDSKGKKSYFTHLYAIKWEIVSSVTQKDRSESNV